MDIHLFVVVARRVGWRRTVTGNPSILLRGNAGVGRALHKARGPRPWSWWGGCGSRRDSTAGLWGEVQVWLWRRGVGKARGHGEEKVVRQSFIRLQNTTQQAQVRHQLTRQHMRHILHATTCKRHKTSKTYCLIWLTKCLCADNYYTFITK